ncbi:hypothetical protein [Persicirhabdus sediminis]|uniref:Uncharacterized protein n=1 Tax=Persicirhabdus sediminis TaxID=454144 RepID=A0A8J7MKF4_9BACT|nr:hypothetical protein [Persicirhabdus sediminis]MBK1792658.1 hypothetical protein [Persicirhabdus sediminis]
MPEEILRKKCPPNANPSPATTSQLILNFILPLSAGIRNTGPNPLPANAYS